MTLVQLLHKTGKKIWAMVIFNVVAINLAIATLVSAKCVLSMYKDRAAAKLINITKFNAAVMYHNTIMKHVAVNAQNTIA